MSGAGVPHPADPVPRPIAPGQLAGNLGSPLGRAAQYAVQHDLRLNL